MAGCGFGDAIGGEFGEDVGVGEYGDDFVPHVLLEWFGSDSTGEVGASEFPPRVMGPGAGVVGAVLFLADHPGEVPAALAVEVDPASSGEGIEPLFPLGPWCAFDGCLEPVPFVGGENGGDF